MKILVINGSPKGEYSITLQTVRYLEQQYPDQTFEVLHVGQKIKALEQDFSSAASAVNSFHALLPLLDCELFLFSISAAKAACTVRS